MDKSNTYWGQLLQQFGCNTQEQLASLGIPIQKEKLYIEALENADAQTRADYEKVAALTLLHTHFRFVEYALQNDRFSMHNWAKHYQANAPADDAFVSIHEEIMAFGGVDRLPQDNMRLSAMLLSVYQKLGLSFDYAPVLAVKNAYIEAVNTVLDCIVTNQEPKIPDRRIVKKASPQKTQRYRDTEGYSLATFRNGEYQRYRMRLRGNQTKKTLEQNSCLRTGEWKDFFELLTDCFATVPEAYDLPAGLDPYGCKASDRYAFLAEKLLSNDPKLNDRCFSLLEKAYVAEPANEAYKNARYEYLRQVFDRILQGVPGNFEKLFSEMQNAWDRMDECELDIISQKIFREADRIQAFAAEKRDAFAVKEKSNDPLIAQMWSDYLTELEKECEKIRDRAKSIKSAFTNKRNDLIRKDRIIKGILICGAVLVLAVIAVVIVGVVL